LEVVILPDGGAIAEAVADIVCEVADRKPTALLGLPTGSTPLPAYQEIARRIRSGSADLSQCRICMLDEYIGLPKNHPQLYRSFIDRHIARPFGLSPDQILAPDVFAPDLQQACAAYDKLLTDAGGVDIQLLGLGSDGHIAFNEPCSSLASRTRVKTLTSDTRMANSRFFDKPEQMPRLAVTQGIATILEARQLVLIATGSVKATAAARTIEGPLAAYVPASAVQLHPNAVVMLDEPAAAQLTIASYFRETRELKAALLASHPPIGLEDHRVHEQQP
jgi:glucosamine-6-phosphate deaminase